MTLKLIGQAAPFGVPNSYSETLAPDAFARFMREEGTKPLPMKFMHQRQIGEWRNLHFAPGWLHCLGILDDRDAEYAVRHRQMEELSIQYATRRAHEKYLAMKASGDKSKKALTDAMLGTRCGRGIEALANRLSHLPATEAIERLFKISELPTDEYEQLISMAARDIPETVKDAVLTEISVVDHGSFGGTCFHWEPV